ncbi:MAG: hypothetical protein CMP11_08175 [Zetaproteobacteria bacterium]|nr:hypothetical protein [Pseudobdellovibrionaceae bacterium]
MIKKILNLRNLLCFFTLVVAFHGAQANNKKDYWNCSLDFALRGGGFKLIKGKFSLKGPGLLICKKFVPGKSKGPKEAKQVLVSSKDELKTLNYNEINENDEIRIPLLVKMGESLPNFEFSIGRLYLKGRAYQAAYVSSLESLIGDYTFFHTLASLGIGGGVSSGLIFSKDSKVINLSLSSSAGLAFSTGVSKLSLDLLQ